MCMRLEHSSGSLLDRLCGNSGEGGGRVVIGVSVVVLETTTRVDYGV